MAATFQLSFGDSFFLPIRSPVAAQWAACSHGPHGRLTDDYPSRATLKEGEAPQQAPSYARLNSSLLEHLPSGRGCIVPLHFVFLRTTLTCTEIRWAYRGLVRASRQEQWRDAEELRPALAVGHLEVRLWSSRYSLAFAFLSDDLIQLFHTITRNENADNKTHL